MKKEEKLLVAIYDNHSVTATFSVLGEEEGRKVLDSNADRHSAEAVAAYLVNHKNATVQCGDIEYEEPCEEHPDQLYVYIHVLVEE